jgi:hypothetical protein
MLRPGSENSGQSSLGFRGRERRPWLSWRLEDTQPKGLDTEEVLRHTQDLKVLLSKGTLTEQKAFLKSFIRRIDLGLGQVAIDYTIPVPVGKDRTSEREVLSIERLGSPLWIKGKTRSRTFEKTFALAY